MTISLTKAAKLWTELRTAFQRIDQLIPEIIETKAWEPLGYNCFTEAWAAKMSDISIASEMRPHVVYAMFNEGADTDAVMAAVKGIGPRQAEVLKRQKSNGVPAHAASTIVREHARKKPSAKRFLHISLGASTLKRYEQIARRQGATVEEIAMAAIQERFDSMVELSA